MKVLVVFNTLSALYCSVAILILHIHEARPLKIKERAGLSHSIKSYLKDFFKFIGPQASFPALLQGVSAPAPEDAYQNQGVLKAPGRGPGGRRSQDQDP